jgi:hypothetical protein
MKTGKNGNYYWIEWQDRNKFLKDLLSEFPQLVLGKHLVNTSFDSGSLSLSPEEINQGWFARNKFTFSPQITNVESISGYGYDEWYIFDSPKTFDNCEVFINYWLFSLDYAMPGEIQNSFWKQLESLNPESYIAEGDNLICATRNENLFNQISRPKTD